MNRNIGKITVFLLFSVLLTNSCQLSRDESDKFQVYDVSGSLFISPFTEDMNLAAVPKTVQMIDDYLSYDWHGSVEDPWEIRGYIRNGKMFFDFPDIEFDRTYFSDLYSIKGAYVFRFYIQQINPTYPHTEVDLHKNIFAKDHGEIYILYATSELDIITWEGSIELKAGWNFLEKVRNPSDEADEPGVPIYIVGLISQNINDFLEKGYRWHIGRWIN